MKIHPHKSQSYRIPGNLNKFQLKMYLHLIDYKWQTITREPGTYNYKGEKILYDAIIPDSLRESFPVIYAPIREAFRAHHKKFPFRLHEHFNHMVSSQAANVNLFFPILTNKKSNEVLRQLKSDFAEPATDHLDCGFRLEFWDGDAGSSEKGLLNDHNQRSGTDSDIAIAYYNKTGELCLWLIEHKLTEVEFTSCGGCKSSNRKPNHDCERSFDEILENKNLCYYHDIRKFNYWNITESHKDFFPNHTNGCPFKGGLNQLWRNQLLGLALEDRQSPYKKVYFSVVRHKDNNLLEKSIGKYKELILNKDKFGKTEDKFSEITSDKIVEAAENCRDEELNMWVMWYRRVYNC